MVDMIVAMSIWFTFNQVKDKKHDSIDRIETNNFLENQ